MAGCTHGQRKSDKPQVQRREEFFGSKTQLKERGALDKRILWRTISENGMEETDLQREFSYLQSAKGTRLSQWQKWDSNTTAVWLCTLTRDCQPQGNYLRAASQRLFTSLTRMKMSRIDSVAKLTPPLPVCGFLLHSSPPDDSNCCSRCTGSRNALPLSSEWVPSPEMPWTNSELVMTFQKSPSWVPYNSHPSRIAQYATILFPCFPESAREGKKKALQLKGTVQFYQYRGK